MRRKDREMSSDFALEVIDRAVYATIAVTDEAGAPYALPISIVRVGQTIYIHTAKAGRKVDLFRLHPEVCLVAVGRVQVPECYSPDELTTLLNTPSRHGELGSRIFTTEYESAIVKGRIKLVEDESERVMALTRLSEKYCPGKEKLIDAAIAASGNHTFVYAIEIISVTGKRKLI